MICYIITSKILITRIAQEDELYFKTRQVIFTKIFFINDTSLREVLLHAFYFTFQ